MAFYQKNFSAKIFLRFFIIFLGISVSLITLFVYHENRSLTDNLVSDGLSLTRLVANNSKLGVYIEDPELFKDAIEGVLGHDDFMSIVIYNVEGVILAERGEMVSPANIREMKAQLSNGSSPVFMNLDDRFEFWAPIVSSDHYGSEESLFFESNSKKRRLIGFVRVVAGKERLKENYLAVLNKGIFIGGVFLVIGSIVILLIAQDVTKPLNKLTEGVKALEKGDPPPQISEESTDEIGRLTGAFNHMTKSLKKREEEKRRLIEKLGQSRRLEAIGTFAGGISHDFNNILTIIQNNLDLANSKAPEYISPYIKKALNATARGNDLITRLLHFGSEAPSVLKPITLGPLVQETIKLTREMIDSRILLNVRIEPNLWKVKADAGQIQQVVINLVKNAHDAIVEMMENAQNNQSDSSFSIEISVSNINVGDEHCEPNPLASKGNYVVLSIRDNGCGMDNSTAQRIFEPLFSTKPAGIGTGLGLSSAYRILKNHGGWIEVRSRPGEGAEFDVYIPSASKYSENKMDKSRQLNVAGGIETILLVDDENDIIAASRERLEDMGYDVLVARDGNKALEILHDSETAIELVILDHIMPGITGLEVLGEILNLNPRPKVIMCSGKEINNQIENLEGITFLRKPFTLDALSNTVRDLLGKGRQYNIDPLKRLKLYQVAEHTVTPFFKSEINDSKSVYEIFRHIAHEPREKFIALFIDKGNRIIGYDELSTGTTDQVTIHPKEVVRMALMANASAVILIHNHPSGELKPSQEDIIITAAVGQAFKVMDLQLLDHIVISTKGYLSLSDEGYFDD
jgi:signal transduction histidine kinase/DNA repair protein RadC